MAGDPWDPNPASCERYDVAMKVVGGRRDRPSTIADAQALQEMAIGMRRVPWLVPRSGVHRFASFEEAERWMLETTARTYASLKPRTSPASAVR